MRGAVCGLILMLTACAPASDHEPVPTTEPPPDPATTTTTAPTTTEATGEQPECLDDATPFQQDGNVGTLFNDTSDAGILARIQWEQHSGCERLVIEFATAEGAPAVEPPTVGSFFIREAGVLRMTLGQPVVATAVAEQLVQSALVDRVFVVRTLDGGLFVDVHLAQAAFARMTTATGPARTLIDLQPGGPDYPASARRSGDVIVVEPVQSTLSYPFSVTGYLRTGAEEAEGTVVSLGDGETATAAGTVGDQSTTWGAFVILFPDGPSGRISVNVAGAVTFEALAG